MNRVGQDIELIVSEDRRPSGWQGHHHVGKEEPLYRPGERMAIDLAEVDGIQVEADELAEMPEFVLRLDHVPGGVGEVDRRQQKQHRHHKARYAEIEAVASIVVGLDAEIGQRDDGERRD